MTVCPLARHATTALLVVAPLSVHAMIFVENGKAEVGVLFGASFDTSIEPPVYPSTAQYDFRDLPATLAATITKDWADMTYGVNTSVQPHITFQGSTREAFSGFYNPASGWLYGKGVATFTISFRLDETYAFHVLTRTGSAALPDTIMVTRPGGEPQALPNDGHFVTGTYDLRGQFIGGVDFAPGIGMPSVLGYGFDLQLVRDPDYVPGIPEPSTWFLSAIGLVSVSAAVRRRRRDAAGFRVC